MFMDEAYIQRLKQNEREQRIIISRKKAQLFSQKHNAGIVKEIKDLYKDTIKQKEFVIRCAKKRINIKKKNVHPNHFIDYEFEEKHTGNYGGYYKALFKIEVEFKTHTGLKINSNKYMNENVVEVNYYKDWNGEQRVQSVEINTRSLRGEYIEYFYHTCLIYQEKNGIEVMKMRLRSGSRGGWLTKKDEIIEALKLNGFNKKSFFNKTKKELLHALMKL